MRKLSTEKRAMILTALVEGNSIASTCRMLSVSKVTVLRLLGDAGTFAAQIHDEFVTGLDTKVVQLDEIWSFIHAKARNTKTQNFGKYHGDNWTWVSIDADTRLVINWLTGGRDSSYACPFVEDLASRLNGRVQISSDGWQCYLMALSRAFGSDVDFGMLIKKYERERQIGPARYSPPRCTGIKRKTITGNPNHLDISTSYVERQNLTLRMQSRRFTRLTNGFSKRKENHDFAIALHYLNYNFIRKHQTLKTTPAVAAGIADKAWTMLEFVTMMEAEEKARGKRITDYKPAASKQ